MYLYRMSNTFTQIFIQVVFAVKGRQNLISETNREQLEKYMTGIINNRGQKLLAIFCMPDHVHILIGFKPNVNLSDLVRDIKAGSSHYINEKNWIMGKFRWQEGYGAFSYSSDRMHTVINYILNQKQHHSKKTFRSEYVGLLNEFDIKYEEKYLFEFVE
jgi:putative transposase